MQPPARVQIVARQRAILPRDLGLQSRMLLTLFLLGLLYVGFVVVLASAGASAVTMVVVIGGLTLAQLFLSGWPRWAPSRCRPSRHRACTR